MKKILAAVLIFLIFPSGRALAVSTAAESCAVMSCETRQVLYADNAHQKMGMASTTKIMTAIVALENADTEKIITVSKNAQNQEGSSIYLREGEEIPLRDLLYGLMLNSGNDAAVAIAEGIAGNVADFVGMMNEKAREIGCENTHFENPSGLSEKGHYSTAYDLALMMSYAMENEAFAEIVSQKSHKIATKSTVTYLKNHNKLLWQTKECIGGKTGYTKANGRCLVSCAVRDGARIIAVTLNDKNDWADHKSLYDYAFVRLKSVQIVQKNDILCTKTVRGRQINVLAGSDFWVPLENGRKRGVVCRIKLDKSINSSIIPRSVIGSADIYVREHKIGSIDILSGQSVDGGKREFFECFDYTMKKMLLQ